MILEDENRIMDRDEVILKTEFIDRGNGMQISLWPGSHEAQATEKVQEVIEVVSFLYSRAPQYEKLPILCSMPRNQRRKVFGYPIWNIRAGSICSGHAV